MRRAEYVAVALAVVLLLSSAGCLFNNGLKTEIDTLQGELAQEREKCKEAQIEAVQLENVVADLKTKLATLEEKFLEKVTELAKAQAQYEELSSRYTPIQGDRDEFLLQKRELAERNRELKERLQTLVGEYASNLALLQKGPEVQRAELVGYYMQGKVAVWKELLSALGMDTDVIPDLERTVLPPAGPAKQRVAEIVTMEEVSDE